MIADSKFRSADLAEEEAMKSPEKASITAEKLKIAYAHITRRKWLVALIMVALGLLLFYEAEYEGRSLAMWCVVGIVCP